MIILMSDTGAGGGYDPDINDQKPAEPDSGSSDGDD